MDIVESLKKEIDTFFTLVSKIAEMAGVAPDKFRTEAETELAAFAMYISASDGTIRWEEAKVISDLFDLRLSPETVGNFIEKYNIYSEAFERSTPEALKLSLVADRVLVEQGKEPGFCSALFDVYKHVAAIVACADGEGSDAEAKDTCIYLENMAAYIKNA